LPGLYRSFFERHFADDASYAPARTLLEVVVAAAEPLAADQLASASGLDPDYELPRILGQLASYLPERDGRYAAYHKSLIDWLTAPESFRGVRRNFAASPKRGHQRLADWCWSEYQRGPERMSPYARRYLPTHLIETARWDDLAAVLRDLPYLEARAETGQVFDLALDFTRAGERLPADLPAHRHLRLVEQAMRLDLHFLARHPTALFQCLWNRCWWYDCPEAAAHYDPPANGWPAEGPPWSRPDPDRLAKMLESWREAKERTTPGFPWLRSLRPPSFPLGGAELACLRGHIAEVWSVAYSNDGRRIVSGSEDQTMRVWDAQSGAELACLRGHIAEVWSVAWAPDGRHIVSGSRDKTVRVWDAQSGAELTCLQGHTRGVRSVAWAPDGRRIVSGSHDGTVRVWDAQSGAELAHLRGHTDGVRSVAWAPDGRRIVSGSHDGTVRVWDAQSGAALACLCGHTSEVDSVAWAPDGRRFVSGSWDGTIRVWDAQSGAALACLCGHTGGVRSVAWAPDGRHIISGSWDQTIRKWDAQSGAELACLKGHTERVEGVAWAPGGRRIVSGSRDTTVRVWDALSGAALACLRGHTGEVEGVAWAPGGRRIVSGSHDETVRVWDAQSGAALACLRGHTGEVDSVAWAPDGRRFVSGSWDKTVRVWDAQSGGELACLKGHTGEVMSVAYSPDGRRIVSAGGSFDQTVRAWDSESGECLEVIRGRGDVEAIAAGVGSYPYRVLNRDQETVIEPAVGGDPVAWFPDALISNITTHPSGYIWAGSDRDQLYIIQLEGEPKPTPPGGKAP
jgi:WD40 repeat protein